MAEPQRKPCGKFLESGRGGSGLRGGVGGEGGEGGGGEGGGTEEASEGASRKSILHWVFPSFCFQGSVAASSAGRQSSGPRRKVSGRYFLASAGVSWWDQGTRAEGLAPGPVEFEFGVVGGGFVGGIVPVVPAGGVEVGGELGVDEDDAGVGAPGAAEAGGAVGGGGALGAGVAASMGGASWSMLLVTRLLRMT